MRSVKYFIPMRIGVLCLGLICLHTTVSAAELRIGLAQQPDVEIRCDGNMELTLGGGSTAPVSLSAGIYTVRLVETPDFYRAAPLVAGVISTPHPSLVAVGALREPAQAWRVELLRTDSTKKADRAERDARQKIGGKIERLERNGWTIIQAGPFPNEYLARQTLKKARGAGFPAQIRVTSVQETWEGLDASSDARQVRRLVPEGEVLSLPEQPEFNVEISPDRQESVPLEPLDLIPESELALEPLPTLEPEELMVEPLPEPEKADLGPEIGYVPAPKADSPPPRKLKRIRPPLPSEPRAIGPRSFSRGRPPSQSQASGRAAQPPRPVPGPAPAPPRQQRRIDLPSQPAEPTPFPTEAPSQVSAAEPRPAPTPVPIQRPAFKERRIEPRQRPPIPPGTVRSRRPTEPPVVRSEVPTAPPPVFLPKERKSRFSRALKSFPIIRKFWWEPPLIGPPSEPDVNVEDAFVDALRKPADRVPPEDSVAMVPPPPIPGEPELPSVPPTPKPFDPAGLPESVAADDGGSGEVMVPSPGVQPYPVELETEILPPETTEAPVSVARVDDVDSLPLDPEDGWDEEAPPFIPDTAEGVSAPQTTVPESAVAEPVKESAPGRSIVAPKVGPVARAYVQVFDDNGEPVTDPATSALFRPLTSSRLEYNGHSYHGNLQAYAPSQDFLVLVNEVNVEDYVAGIIAGEIPTDAPLEVLKAQAVMSRCYTFLLAQQGEYADLGFDILGTPDSEWPYSGRESETPETQRAARETAGEVLVDDVGEIATPVYHFSSGGYVADAESVWGGEGEPVPAYLTARPDFDVTNSELAPYASGFTGDEKLLKRWLTSSPETYDKRAAGDHFRWSKKMTDDGLETLVNSYWRNGVGRVKSIEITKRSKSGHAAEMVIVGSAQTVTAYDSHTIREALNLDSSLIVIEKRLMGSWVIHGGGYGHGVGLSQCGAIGLVEQAQANYRHVLNFYFEALRLGKRDLVRSSRGA